jgi:hypothetical protein
MWRACGSFAGLEFPNTILSRLQISLANKMASAEVEAPNNFANNFWVSSYTTVTVSYTPPICTFGRDALTCYVCPNQGRNDAGTEVLRARMLSSKQTNEDLKTFYNVK